MGNNIDPVTRSEKVTRLALRPSSIPACYTIEMFLITVYTLLNVAGGCSKIIGTVVPECTCTLFVLIR